MSYAYYDLLVLGDGGGAGLACVRSLGRRGLRVLAGYHEPRCLEFVSRYAAECRQYPPPWEAPRRFVAHVLDMVERHAIPVVIPVHEAALAALDAERGAVEQVTRLAAPPSASLRFLWDKERLLAVAADTGLPVPRTVGPRSTGEAVAAAEAWGYPVILKPRRPLLDLASGTAVPASLRVTACIVESPHELRQRLAPFAPAGPFPLVQEFVPGWITTLHAFALRGRVISLGQHRPQWHVGGLHGWMRMEAVAPDPRLARYLSDFLAAVEYDGLVTVQFLCDRASGRATFLEADPGPSPTMAVGVRAGQDLPWMLYQYYRTGHVATARPRPGARTAPISAEVQTVAECLRTPARRASYPDAASRWGAVAHTLRDILDPRIGDTVWSWRDPLPGLVDIALCARQLARLALPHLGRGGARYRTRHQPAEPSASILAGLAGGAAPGRARPSPSALPPR